MSPDWHLHETAPEGADALRRALYEGNVFKLAPTSPSVRLVEIVRRRLGEALGTTRIREAGAALSNDEFFARMGAIRRALYLETSFHRAVREVIEAVGFDPSRVAFDPLRLRIIMHKGHENPLAAPVYHAHRDTWYAHPQALVAWWIPLDDLPEDETFVFYPDMFRVPVANDSERFDYDDWVRDGWALKIGWQKLQAGVEASYPHAKIDGVYGRAVGFSCRAGENLLFSGAHLHATRPQARGRTRFSLDFRVVDLADALGGVGAPNADNRSRGSALRDYVHPNPPQGSCRRCPSENA